MCKNTPVILFTYNRPWHTKKVLDSLASNIESKSTALHIFCDGAKENADDKTVNNIEEVRKVAQNENRFSEVVVTEQVTNKGLARSIIDGVTNVLKKYDRVIVLEDDLIVSRYFLEYMNTALDLYKDDDEVISIHGFNLPSKRKFPETFFIKGADCWGWATWKRGWDLFESDGRKLLKELTEKKLTRDFDFNNSYNFTQMLKDQISEKNNSWAIRWYASAFLKNKLTLYPQKSLVLNIGFDGTGTHCDMIDNYTNHGAVKDTRISVKKIPLVEDIISKSYMSGYYKTLSKNFYSRIIDKVVRLFKK